MMVKLGRMTSDPSGNASAAIAISIATVPLQTATPCATPQYSAHRRSNSVMKRPSEEIQPELTAS
jgi:hypothetical protein